MSNIFFFSDTHFGHNNIRKYCNRPFSSVEEMNESIIENWNKTVNKKDRLFFLGDFSFGINKEEVSEILARLNGKIKFIPGNHDKELLKLPNIDILYSLFEFKLNKQKLILCHYPLESWNGMWKGSLHLHGHIHSTEKYKIMNHDNHIYRFHIGYDAWQRPVSLDEILEIVG